MRTLPPAITSRSNPRVKALRASLSGDARRPGDLLGLESEHLIAEAHAAGLSFDTVYLREGSEPLLDRADWGSDLRTQHWAVLGKDAFDSAVTTLSPQGIAATWAIREAAPRSNATSTSVLVAENIQDPGNLGTLIRSAAAFGFGRVLVTPECVNEWNPKVVRAAAGAIFHLPVKRLPLQEIAAQLRSQQVRLFAAVSDAPAQAASEGTPAQAASLSTDTSFTEPCAILIGNEGAGLSPAARQLADEPVRIPCSVESLNAAVAGSVLMYEVMRQRTLRASAHQQKLRP